MISGRALRRAAVVLAALVALAACGGDADVSSGEAVFDNHCIQCHGAGGRGSLGPELQTVLLRYGWTGADDGSLATAREAVRTVVLEGLRRSGRAPMPAFEGRLDADEVEALLDHLIAIQRVDGVEG